MLPQSPMPIPDDTILFRGGQLVVSAHGRQLVVDSAHLVQVHSVMESPEIAHNECGMVVAYAYTGVCDVDLKFRCYPGIGTPIKRKEIVERICAGLSVKELLQAVEGRLQERGKQGVRDVG